MKTQKIVYWVITGLFAAMMLMSAGMYVFNHTQVGAEFAKLGYPLYVIYPLALAKVLGVVAILSKISPRLKEWAYAGFFFDFVLAGAAHTVAKDGESGGALIALILLFASYYFERRVFGSTKM